MLELPFSTSNIVWVRDEAVQRRVIAHTQRDSHMQECWIYALKGCTRVIVAGVTQLESCVDQVNAAVIIALLLLSAQAVLS